MTVANKRKVTWEVVDRSFQSVAAYNPVFSVEKYDRKDLQQKLAEAKKLIGKPVVVRRVTLVTLPLRARTR